MGIREGHLEYPGGLKVRYYLNEYNDRVVLLHLHDLGERLEHYQYLYPYFDLNEIAYNSIELRGHGESGGEILSIDDCADFLKDCCRFISGNLPESKLYIMGSGIGSLLALRLAQDVRIAPDGLILLSPLIIPQQLSFADSILVLFRRFFGGKRDAYYLLSPEEQSSDDEMIEIIRSEHLRLARFPSLSLAASVQREIKRFLRGAAVSIPVFILLPQDSILGKAAEVEALLSGKMTGEVSVYHTQKKHSLLLDKGRIDLVEKIIQWVVKTAGLPGRK